VDLTADQARDRVILANLKLVRRIASDFRWSRLDLDDLVSAGTIGLIRAVDRFDVHFGISFGEFSRIWIRCMIAKEVAQSEVPDRGGSGINLDALPSRSAECESVADDVWAAIEKLPPEDQSVIVHMGGLGGEPAEGRDLMALRLGISEMRARKVRARSIRALRRQLQLTA
jgi:RNA polymerase sigma factor (sigma-70 family)